MARLNEVELRVADVDRSVHFYRDLLGIEVNDPHTHEGDETRHCHADWGSWGDGADDFLLFSVYPAGGEAATRASIGFSVPDVPALHERLVGAGVTVVQPPVDKPWGTSATYLDPDGNTVSITSP